LPEVKLTETDKLAGKPAIESLPKGSRDLTTGCVVNTEPAVALPGWVVKTKWSASPALTAIWAEKALVRLPLLNRMVMLVGTLWERLVKVTTPLIAVRLVVPCKVPLPALRLAVTVVALSLLRRLPNRSSIRITGC